MKLEFKKRKLDIDLYGEAVEMQFPTVKQYKDYQEKIKSADKDRDYQIMIDFMIELGLPADKIDDMEPEHLGQIMETLSGSKKK